MSNIVEGYERSGKREFIQFLSIAKGSAGETKSLLIVAVDQKYIDQETYNRIFALADETSRLITGLMDYLKTSSFKGTKFNATDDKNVRP